MSEAENPTVHFAVSENTACGRHINGGTFYTSDEPHGNTPLRYWMQPVQHTAIKGLVTCGSCCNTQVYKKAEEE